MRIYKNEGYSSIVKRHYLLSDYNKIREYFYINFNIDIRTFEISSIPICVRSFLRLYNKSNFKYDSLYYEDKHVLRKNMHKLFRDEIEFISDHSTINMNRLFYGRQEFNNHLLNIIIRKSIEFERHEVENIYSKKRGLYQMVCPICIQEQLDKYGEYYNDKFNYYPLNIVCLRHNQLLVKVDDINYDTEEILIDIIKQKSNISNIILSSKEQFKFSLELAKLVQLMEKLTKAYNYDRNKFVIFVRRLLDSIFYTIPVSFPVGRTTVYSIEFEVEFSNILNQYFPKDFLNVFNINRVTINFVKDIERLAYGGLIQHKINKVSIFLFLLYVYMQIGETQFIKKFIESMEVSKRLEYTNKIRRGVDLSFYSENI